MEKIRQAVERARGPNDANFHPPDQLELRPPHPAANANATSLAREATLNSHYLEANRIISYDIADPRSKAFDMLRTQVLQTMDLKNWKTLGIVSPKPGCGKTVTAINLALSIARQPDRSVLLVDMDLQKPQVANYLGIKVDSGLLSVLEGRTRLSNALVEARIRNEKIAVLPCESSTLRSSEWMASRAMGAVFQEINRDFKNWTVILDLAPILTSDDVITILPQIDCVLFVTAAGLSTVSDIKECNKHLETTPVVRVVLNKASQSAAEYYSRYGKNGRR